MKKCSGLSTFSSNFNHIRSKFLANEERCKKGPAKQNLSKFEAPGKIVPNAVPEQFWSKFAALAHFKSLADMGHYKDTPRIRKNSFSAICRDTGKIANRDGLDTVLIGFAAASRPQTLSKWYWTHFCCNFSGISANCRKAIFSVSGAYLRIFPDSRGCS